MCCGRYDFLFPLKWNWSIVSRGRTEAKYGIISYYQSLSMTLRDMLDYVVKVGMRHMIAHFLMLF